MIAKGALNEGATGWAQGGVAAVLEEGDSFENHVRDTMDRRRRAQQPRRRRACRVRGARRRSPASPRSACRSTSTTTANGWHLTREGGHSHRRIVHVADATGWAIQQALEKAAAAHPNITLVPDMVAIDLVTGRHAERFLDQRARSTGSTPSTAPPAGSRPCSPAPPSSPPAGRGAPISIRPRRAARPATASRWRGAPGCRVSNMEFMQFHPTCLYNLEVKNFLITEAVRGEGGLLKHPRDRPPLHARL